jgi:capsular exopolysaccharide synthesis family protein
MADIVPSTRPQQHEIQVTPVFREQVARGQVSAVSLWKAFRARWLRALLAGVVLGVGFAAAAFVSNPARYNTASLVRVLSSKAGVFDHAPALETDKSPFQRAQPSLVSSRGVLRTAATSERGRAVAATGKYGDLTGWLERNIKVGYLEDTDLMQISLAGHDAKETADLLNLVVGAYIEEANKAERGELSARIETLNTSAITMSENLRQEKDKLDLLQRTLHTVVDPKALSIAQSTLVEEHASARKEVSSIQAQLRELEVKRNTFKSLVEAPAGQSSHLVEQQVEANPLVVKQAASLRTAEDNLGKARSNGIPGVTKLTRFEDAVKLAKQQLEETRAEVRHQVAALVEGRTRVEAAVELKRIEEEIRIRKDHQRSAIEFEELKRKELDRLGTYSFELEAKRAEIEQAKAVLNKVREQKEQLLVESQSDRPRILLIQKAEPPESKNTRSRDTLAALAGVAGLFLGVFGTSFVEFRARRIQSAEDVSVELGMNVVGTLPVLPNRWSAGNGTGDGYWGHLVTESVAYIRTVVLSGRCERPTQVLMITSAQSQEGKTMLASNLALSIARTGRRTLLVDGDLRRPSVAPLFGVQEGPGIAEILRGEAVTGDCLCPSAMPGLSLLPAGRCCRQAIQELAREGIEKMFRQLRESFDFIVVDSSPILPVSDSLLLGRLVDAVVFCVRPKVSRAPSVHAAHEMLSRLNIPVLGTVINGAQRHSGGGGDYLYLLSENGKNGQNGQAAPAAGAKT